MSQDLNDPVYREIVTARIKLLLEKPFFGNLAVRLIAVEAPWCNTAATDGRHLFYNREFIKDLGRPKLLFLIGHEVLHVVLDHLGRRGGRDPKIWNMACLAWDTPILMADGSQQPIQRVLPGDQVASPFGPSRVFANMFSGIRATLNFTIGDRHVRATPDHKFAASAGFLDAAKIIKEGHNGYVLNGDLPAIALTCDRRRHMLERRFLHAIETSGERLLVSRAGSAPMSDIDAVEAVGFEQRAARERLAGRFGVLEDAALSWARDRAFCRAGWSATPAGFTAMTPDRPALSPVFDLVTEAGSFFANGVLTHNCDYLINYILVNEKVGTMPEQGLYDQKFTDEMSADEIYEILKRNSVTIKMPLDDHLELGNDANDGDGEYEGDGYGQAHNDENPIAKDGSNRSQNNNTGNGGGNQPDTGDGGGNQQPNGGRRRGQKSVDVTVMGRDGPPKLSEDDLEKIRNDIKAAVIQTAQQCAGNVPLGIKRLISELVEPKMDWRTLLDAHVRSQVKDDYTFQRLSRRTWGTGAIMPAQNFIDRVEVWCAIDASGSTTEKMVTDFLSEVKGIMESFRDFRIGILCFDVNVYNVYEITPENFDDVYGYTIKGGGGTMFEAVFEYFKAEGIEPNRLAFFTDGLPNSTWGDPDYCDTIFIIHSNPQITAPYGLTAHYDEADKHART